MCCLVPGCGDRRDDDHPTGRSPIHEGKGHVHKGLGFAQMAHDRLEEQLRPPFTDPQVTAEGHPRAKVRLAALRTLWFNTGTLCNIACAHCYIESSPRNDRLVYLSAEEVARYLDELDALGIGPIEIGLTGGEPFMNPDIIRIMRDALGHGHRLLVLTNAMKPMWHKRAALYDLGQRFADRLTLRVSVDHYDPARHEEERGPRSFAPMRDGLRWLCENGFTVTVAGRLRWGEKEEEMRAGYAAFFAREGIAIDAFDAEQLILFPEMDPERPAPEITTACWDILGVRPEDVMCASSRMVVKPKGGRPRVQACTLLAYDPRFCTGESLAEALASEVSLNHPHCAQFCVLGGGSCS